MGLRNRWVKADFWSDAKLAGLSDTAKLLYIGLWAEADDYGWLRWEERQLAIDLRIHKPEAEGIADLNEAAKQLIQRKRLAKYRCGHAFIFNLAKHQDRITEAKRTHGIRDEHLRKCVSPAGSPRKPRGSAAAPPPRGKEGRGKGREGGGDSQSDDSTSHTTSNKSEENGMPDEFMDDHLKRVTAPKDEDEQVQVWVDFLAGPGKNGKLREKGVAELAKLGYRLKDDGELELIEP